MRPLSSDFERYISKKQALDVSYAFDIHWDDGVTSYSDSDFVSEIRVDWVENDIIPGGSFSCDISLNLEPDFFRDRKIIGARVDLYLKVKDQREFIGTGKISSPIEYRNKVLNFTVFSQYDDHIIDPSAVDIFPEIKNSKLDKFWPLIFGTVSGSPCVKLSSSIIGILESDEAIADYTLEPRMEQVKEIACPYVQTRAYGEGTMASLDVACLEARENEYCKLEYSLQEQKSQEHKSFEVTNGQNFPQNTPYEINIEGGIFQGYFSGNTFTIQGRVHPLKNYLGEVQSKELPPVEVQFVDPFDLEKGCEVEVPQAYTYYGTEYQKANKLISDIYDFCQDSNDCWMTETKNSYLLNLDTGKPNYNYVLPKVTDDLEALGVYYQLVESVNHHNLITQILAADRTVTEYYNMKIAGRFTAPAGSSFSLAGAGPIFLASLVPGVVFRVLGYKKSTCSHPGKLVEIPDSNYEIREVDYGDFTGVEIHFNKPLEQISECLGDEVCVDFESDVGPNPVDVIEWIINLYTDLNIDEESFAYVKSKLEKYPIGFTLQEKISAFQLIKDIAYQSRCALNIWDNTFYIHYLSEKPSSCLTIDSSKIYQGYNITTSDVVSTKEIVTWKNTYAPRKDTDPKENKFFIEQNVDEYGLIPHESKYSCLNLKNNVQKSATFWFIRDSNAWKFVTFKGPLSLLKLNIYDGVYFEPLDVICVVTNISVEVDGITLTLWTPIRFGENEEYYWAWPANKSENKIFDLNYTPLLVPPSTHPFFISGNYARDYDRDYDWDRYPSDRGDSIQEWKFFFYDFDDVDCWIGGEGYWEGDETDPDGYDYEDNPFDIPHGGYNDGGGDTNDEELVDSGNNVFGRPYVPYVDDQQAQYRRPEDDIEDREQELEQSGDCWFWHYVFKVTCDYPYCFQKGPCEKQNCLCGPMCCIYSDDLICEVEMFSDCQTNMSQWLSNHYNSGALAAKCKGQQAILDVQPTPSESTQSCCDLPHMMWKTTDTCTSLSGQKYNCDETGQEISCDYYCKGVQSGSRSVTQTIMSGFKNFSNHRTALPGMCSGDGKEVRDYLTSTGQMSFGGTTTFDVKVNKTTGEVKVKLKLFPETFKELYDNVQDAYATTAFQDALVAKYGYHKAVEIFTQNKYSTQVMPDGAIVYMYNGDIIYRDTSLIWMGAMWNVKEYYDYYGSPRTDPMISELQATETTYYIKNPQDPESEWKYSMTPGPNYREAVDYENQLYYVWNPHDPVDQWVVHSSPPPGTSDHYYDVSGSRLLTKDNNSSAFMGEVTSELGEGAVSNVYVSSSHPIQYAIVEMPVDINSKVFKDPRTSFSVGVGLTDLVIPTSPYQY